MHLSFMQSGGPWTPDEFAERAEVFLALWSRTFHAPQTSIIKATSFVSEMSRFLMNRVEMSRSVFMYVLPETFLKALLDGAMSDIASEAERRLCRLKARFGELPWRLSDLSPGECVAMSWLSEMSALFATSQEFASRVLWIDFDGFLEEPAHGLMSALHHFCGDINKEEINHVLSGSIMCQYAKKPNCNFDANMRRMLLQRAVDRYPDEIAKGMNWLNHAAAIPGVEEILRAAESRSGHRK
jgi:hypothetical protein